MDGHYRANYVTDSSIIPELPIDVTIQRNFLKAIIPRFSVVAVLVLALNAIYIHTSNAQVLHENPISQMEWESIITSSQPRGDEELTRISNDYLKQANDLFSQGKKNQAIRNTVMGITIARYISEKNKNTLDNQWRENAKFLENIRENLVSLGVSKITQDEVAGQFIAAAKKTLPKDSEILLDKTEKVVNASEKKQIIAAVLKQLKDPTSAIFGEAHTVANDACITVNAKNSYGGYSGNREVTLRKFMVKGNYQWVFVSMHDVSHEQCIFIIKK